MESCRSVFLANLDSVMTRLRTGALWQVARASVQLARAAIKCVLICWSPRPRL
jgi:hypothetical protein